MDLMTIQLGAENVGLKATIDQQAARIAELEAERDEWREAVSDWQDRWHEQKERADAALTALKRLVDLNDNGGPFGGEIYRDRVENAWFKAREAIRALTPPEGE